MKEKLAIYERTSRARLRRINDVAYPRRDKLQRQRGRYALRVSARERSVIDSRINNSATSHVCGP